MCRQIGPVLGTLFSISRAAMLPKRLTTCPSLSQRSPMQVSPVPRIIAADRMQEGLVILFDDGEGAFFSSSLLHAVLPQAEKLPEASPEDNDW